MHKFPPIPIEMHLTPAAHKAWVDRFHNYALAFESTELKAAHAEIDTLRAELAAKP